jgi:cytochrome P450
MAMATATRSPQSPAISAKSWPEVRGHWLMGTLRQLQREPLKLYLEAWKRHGDYIRLRALPGFWWYFLSHPAAIEHVLQTNAKNYRKPNVFYDSVSLLAGDGILTSEGETWRTQRKLIQPVFARHQVAKLSSNIADGTQALIAEWERQEDGRELDVLPDMMRLGLRIISTALFSTDISGDADSIGQAYRTAFEYVSLKLNGRFLAPRWMPTPMNRRFKSSKTLLDRVVLELIAARRNGEPRNDMLDRLLAAQDETSGAGMSDQQLKDEAITLLTAGHETSGAALSWSWHLLATNPDVQENLYEEAFGHLGGRLPTVDDLPALPLATAVFEESMRLYPPAWGLPRETIAPDEIEGYALPAKATIVLSQHVAHRHPDFWREPDRFDPTRFLPGQSAGRPKFAFFPFGGGSRVCVGNHFAMLEGPLVLASLAQRFRFMNVPEHPIVADPTFTLRPKYGVRLVVRRRG